MNLNARNLALTVVLGLLVGALTAHVPLLLIWLAIVVIAAAATVRWLYRGLVADDPEPWTALDMDRRWRR